MTASFSAPPPRDTLRRILETLLDADRKALVMDYFPLLISRISDGMDGRQQTNLLLSQYDDREIWAALSTLAQRDRAVWACIHRQTQDAVPQKATRTSLPPRHALFTGREDILEDLHQKLHQHRGVAITGLGGIGKSSLALEYAHRHEHEHSLVYWLSAADTGALRLALLNLGCHLRDSGLGDKSAPPEHQSEALHHYAIEWLSRRTDWLLVLDNADDPEPLRLLLPDFGRGYLLATTRTADPLALGLRPFELSEFSSDDAGAFLLKRCGMTMETPDEAAARGELAGELGNLPLALEQAGAYIAAHKTPVRSYLAACRKRRAALFPPGPSVQQRTSVTTVWSISFDMVERESPASANLLRFSAFLSPDFIPEQLLHEGAIHIGEVLAGALDPEDPLAIDELLGPLLRHSLIRRLRSGIRSDRTGGYCIHRLVQDVLRFRLGNEERAWAERAVRVINATLAGSDLTGRSWCLTLLASAEDLFSHIERLDLKILEVASLVNLAAVLLDNFLSYPLAEPLIRRALAIHEQELGKDHPDTAASLNNAGWLLRGHGNLKEAEPLFLRALKIYEQVLGPSHPLTEYSVSNLASLLEHLGRPKEAEELHRRGLAIREQLFGADNPYTRGSIRNLAFRLHGQGKLAESEELCRRALEISERCHGSDHPRLVHELSNLAGLLEQLGRLEEAAPLYRRALMICEKTFGSAHRRTIRARQNLDTLLERQRLASV